MGLVAKRQHVRRHRQGRYCYYTMIPITIVLGSFVYMTLLFFMTFQHHVQIQVRLVSTSTSTLKLSHNNKNHNITVNRNHQTKENRQIINNNNSNDNNDDDEEEEEEEEKEDNLDSAMGICLLMKDDNDLLPEFIAYHYHAVDLRYLVVAVDPTSSTSPIHILQRFHNKLPDFRYVVWDDTHYMPDWFIEGDYSRVPRNVGGAKLLNASTLLESSCNTAELPYEQQPVNNSSNSSSNSSTNDGVRSTMPSNKNSSIQSIQNLQQSISNHRYRQVLFVGECIRYLHKQKQRQQHRPNNATKPVETTSSGEDSSTTSHDTDVMNNHTESTSSSSTTQQSSYIRYMAHIDTDEMLVVNPHFLSTGRAYNDSKFLNLTLLERPRSSSSSTTPNPLPATTRTDIGSNNETVSDDEQYDLPHRTDKDRPWLSLEASSVRQLLEAWYDKYPPSQTRSCMYLPRILMGSTVREVVPPTPAMTFLDKVVPSIDPDFVPDGFDPNSFESLRFKWHALFSDNPTNGYGKVILDLDELHQGQDQILAPGERVSTIHQIRPGLCGKELPMTHTIWDHRPLATYHYLGSPDRYCGKDDPRRSTKTYHDKSVRSSILQDGPWLDQWLRKFVQVHGLEKSKQLMPEYVQSK